MYTIRGNEIDYKKGKVCVDIYDIAHSLSIQNRFNGHTIVPYSVAQHSVLVSKFVSKKNALWGLLHDAAETYLGDIITPVKTLKQKSLEIEFLKYVADKFNLSLPIPDEVKKVDVKMLATEMNAAFVFCKPEVARMYLPDVEPYYFEIEPWSWYESKKKFLERFEELK